MRKISNKQPNFTSQGTLKIRTNEGQSYALFTTTKPLCGSQQTVENI